MWDEEMDCAGMLCPLPVLRARKRLLTLAPGRVLRLCATDPMAAIDVPHLCRTEGHELIEVRPEGPVSAYLIRRGTRAAPERETSEGPGPSAPGDAA